MPRRKKEESTQGQEVKETPTPRGRKEKFFSGTGRRKTAVASAFLYSKKGEFLVNGVDVNGYFSLEKQKQTWMRPFHLVGVSHPTSVYSASVRVKGAGKSAQFDAVVLALSKALASSNDEFKPVLLKHGMLTTDSRVVERKKPFLKKARKREQYSKR